MQRIIINILCLNMAALGVNAQSGADTLHRKDLKGVTVTAAKPYIVMKADKTILNVSESPASAGSDALQVIAAAPGIVEQGTGNFELKGKKVTVLVDGKDARLSGNELKEMLAAMPAHSIDKIELISNPSARYDASGAAVLNIITMKSKSFGTNGTLNAGLGVGNYGRYNGGLALNHRSEHLNLYGSYDYQYNKQYYDMQSLRNAGIQEHTFETRTRHNNSFKLGLDEDLNRNSSFGILFKGALNDRDRSEFTRSTIDKNFSTVGTTGTMRLFNPTVNAYYRVKLDSTGKQLTVNADYFGYDKQWSDQLLTRYYDANEEEAQPPYYLRNNSPAHNTIRSLSADYTQPLWKGQLNAGLKATLTTTDNDIRWEQLVEKQWATDSGKTNHFIYKENIYAAYADYNRTIKQFDLSVGLRAEQMFTTGHSLTLQQMNKRQQLNLFPNLSVTYNQSEKNQYSFSYRRDIERYGFDIVNPFITYISQYLYYAGNPNIRPATGQSFELSYIHNNELFATISYQHYSGEPADIYKQDTGNVIISTEVNLRSADAVNASLTWSKAILPGKWMSTNSGMITYAKYNDPGAGQLNNAGIGAYVKTNNIFTIGKGLSAELSGYYFSSIAFGAYKYQPRFTVNAGISQSILHNAGKLSLSASDLFNTLTAKYHVASFGVGANFENKIESRIFRLIFNYKFGNQKVKAAKARTTGIEDEKARMGTN